VEYATGPLTDGLGYVVGAGAEAELTSAAGPECGEDEIPPRVYIAHRALPTNPWSVDHIDLVADPANPLCYEKDDPTDADADWSRIEVISGVAVMGSAVYAATSDGVFWEIDTAQGAEGDLVLRGPIGPWPRFRHDNHARAFKP